MSESRALLRHMVATVAYRGGKAVPMLTRISRSIVLRKLRVLPAKILAHIGDLMEYGLSPCPRGGVIGLIPLH